MNNNRKQDTRRKIQLGGLVIKSDILDSMQGASKASLLGLLMEAKERMNSDPNIQALWSKKGKPFLKPNDWD